MGNAKLKKNSRQQLHIAQHSWQKWYAIIPIINGMAVQSRNYSIYEHVVLIEHGTECLPMIYVHDRLQDRVIPLFNINKQEINAVIVL